MSILSLERFSFRNVILAAGDFPRRGSLAFHALESAAKVICCDGAYASYASTFSKSPFAVLGDGDSLENKPIDFIRIGDQNTNDLKKAIDFAASKGIRDLLVLGATGKREDHTIGNIFLALDERVEVLSEFGFFIPVETAPARLNVAIGTQISLFAPHPETHIKSKGLKWPLDNVSSSSLYSLTLNEAIANEIELQASKPILLYIAL